jgi:hypothetical protein
MGYRNYIGYISKKEYNVIKDFTYEELCKHYDTDYVRPHIVTEIYEFGKYCDHLEFLRDDFFTNKETNEYFNNDDYEFFKTDKSCLKYWIEHYNENVKKYYLDLLDGIDVYGDVKNISEEKVRKLVNHVNSMSSEWNCLTPYDLENGDAVTKAWKYEYEIFELVRIYKTFNFKKNILVYYGY